MASKLTSASVEKGGAAIHVRSRCTQHYSAKKMKRTATITPFAHILAQERTRVTAGGPGGRGRGASTILEERMRNSMSSEMFGDLHPGGDAEKPGARFCSPPPSGHPEG